MADIMLLADFDQVEELRVHRDQIDAERLVGERLGPGDLRIELLGVHRAAGDHAEAAGVGDCGDEVALGHPGHGAAEDGDLAAQEFTATGHAAGEALGADRRCIGHPPA
jgi:hypothetical protein